MDKLSELEEFNSMQAEQINHLNNKLKHKEEEYKREIDRLLFETEKIVNDVESQKMKLKDRIDDCESRIVLRNKEIKRLRQENSNL